MHTVEIRGALRTVVHKRGARQTRAAGKTPGVLYGKDEKSMSISLDSKEFDAVLRKHGGGTFLLDLKLEGQEDRELKAIIKELQRDPVTSRVLHVDLLHVSLTQMIHVNVPIHLTGTAAGVKEGGVLEQHCREIEVQCQVARIPENCKIDITELVKDEIASEEFALYSALADAILDAEKVHDLNRFERWKQIEPIALDQPWDMSGD